MSETMFNALTVEHHNLVRLLWLRYQRLRQGALLGLGEALPLSDKRNLRTHAQWSTIERESHGLRKPRKIAQARFARKWLLTAEKPVQDQHQVLGLK